MCLEGGTDKPEQREQRCFGRDIELIGEIFCVDSEGKRQLLWLALPLSSSLALCLSRFLLMKDLSCPSY